MPTIARFYNIIIKMHYLEDEHCPPHIHAWCNGNEGVFNISSCELIRGFLPNKIIGHVKDFINQHKDRLLEMWNKQNFEKLEY